MPKYYFTSDLRILNLPERIQNFSAWFADGKTTVDIIYDDKKKEKSERNNAGTLQSLFNLYKGTKICEDASSDPKLAIRNYIKKYQIPNTWTLESFKTSIQEKILLAPYRSVASVLLELAVRNGTGKSSVSLKEILAFVFGNKDVYQNPSYSVSGLVDTILKSRKDGKSLDTIIKETVDWSHYNYRQPREMFHILGYASKCFYCKNESVHFDSTIEDYETDKKYIEELASWKLMWYPTESDNFEQSKEEYMKFMDTEKYSYSVIDYSRTTSFVVTDESLDSKTPEEIESLFYNYIIAIRNKSTAGNYRWGLRNSKFKSDLQEHFGVDSIYQILQPATVRQVYEMALGSEYNDDTSGNTSAALGQYEIFLSKYNSKEPQTDAKLDLQLIYFGAPGTSKSTTIKRETEDKGKEVHRVTFHPDTDYSNFVGCYKPIKQKNIADEKQPILDYDSLVDKFKEYLNVPNVNITKACTLFGYDYHDSIVEIQNNGHKVMDLVNDAYKSNTSYDSVVRGGMACYENNPSKISDDKITYEFVAQTFTKAYVSAWRQLEEKKDVFLVIEEINRGNCAQIFGDLFQLLDRNENGYSDYKIEPDQDLQDYLAKELQDYNIPEDIKSGKAMLLPPNLYIWATMNTSDQSLFPIDSAFKRRWDWKYLPIVEPEEKKAEDKKNLVGIKIGGKEYAADWWTFLEKINTKIESLTESEDKQLGYWFAKAKTGRVIDMETFVGKVVFYLWNDIFKDFGEDDRSPFMIYQENDEEHKLSKEKITFRKFFDAKGDVKGEMVKRFIESLEVAVKEVQEDSTATVKTSSSGSDTPASEPELPLEPEPELPLESDPELPLESDPEDQPETEETTESIVPVTVVESHPLTEPKQTDENLF